MRKKSKKVKKILIFGILFLPILIGAVVINGLISAVSFFDGLEEQGVKDVEHCEIEELISYCDDKKIITEDMLDDMMITRKSLKRLLVAVERSNEDDENTSFSVSVQSRVTYLDENGKKHTMKGSIKQVTATTERVTQAYALDWQPVYIAVVADALRNTGEKGNKVASAANQSETLLASKLFRSGIVASAATKKGYTGADFTLVGNSNADKCWNYFKAKGLSDIAAAAMCGNIQAESGYNPASVSKSGIYHGICQWGGGRYENLCTWATRRKVEWTDLKLQLDYCWAELNSSGYINVLNYLKTVGQLQYDTKSQGAVWYVVRYYEGAVSTLEKYGVQAYERRYSYAKAVYTKNGGKGDIVASDVTDDNMDERASSYEGESFRVGRWNDKGTRLILSKAECEDVVSDFAPIYTWNMEQSHSYTFAEAKDTVGAVKKTSGSIDSKDGQEVWYEPGARLLSAELCFADITESEILKNPTRFKSKMLHYMDDYDKDWVETSITALPGGKSCYDHFHSIIDAATGISTDTDNVITASSSLSSSVEQYRSVVKKEAEKLGKGQFTDLFLAVMQQESGGNGTDVFQASESMGLPVNTLSTDRSIKQGVKYLSSCLDTAGCKSPVDIDKIKLALQGYNFGGGYIGYALQKDGKWTQANTIAFAKQKSGGKRNTGSRVTALGPWKYGDSYYTKHVLRYYSYAYNDSSIAVSTDEKAAIAVSKEKRLSWLFPNGAPQSELQMQAYKTQITVPIINESGKRTSMRLTVHKKLAANYKGVFEDLASIGFKTVSSCTAAYTWRTMNSGSNAGKRISYHSYGSCCDYNWTYNPVVYHGEANKTSVYSVTPQVIKIWKKHGFLWGGDWSGGYKDYMHFTYTGN